MVRSRAPTKVGRPEGLVVMAPQRQASLRGSKVTSAPLRSGDPAGETSAGPWTAGIDSRNPEAMFGAGERLYVAEGGRLHVMDLAGGNRRGSLALTLPGADGHDSPPLPRCVFDGFAVAYGRLFVSDADGRLHCFAAARAESRRGSGPDREHAGADPGTAAAGSRRRPDG
jgi:hypothetical protein